MSVFKFLFRSLLPAASALLLGVDRTEESHEAGKFPKGKEVVRARGRVCGDPVDVHPFVSPLREGVIEDVMRLADAPPDIVFAHAEVHLCSVLSC